MGDGSRSSGSFKGLRYLGCGLTFAVLVAAGWWLGDLLDARRGWEPWGKLVGSLLGIAIGTWDLLRTSAAIERSDGEPR
jgi:F0F1-type ATP synthase assembly protein I